MVACALSTILIAAGVSSALPVFHRAATLDPAAVAEAQVRDNTATRAFSAVPITTADGSCLFVDPTSGDFRENLTPVQTAACDGSQGQQWDVITKGVHNDQQGQALIVSTLTNACLNFDPRRAAGNQVLLFSCGGRADGGGQVTDSQLFAFTGGAGPLALAPKNGNNAVCLTVNGGKLDQTACSPNTASGNELFTFGAQGSTSASGASAPAKPTASASATPASSSVAATASSAPAPASPASSAPSPAGTNPAVKTGTRLDPTAVAEAQKKDDTATRALSGVPIKAADGSCLFVDPTSGDFRENLIPIQTAQCDGSAAQQWDVITKGAHDDQVGFALVVSSLTQGCLNFDPRRAAGNQVLLFSCGGRADGGGSVTNSQLFTFSDASKPIPLVPQNGENKTCLVVKDGLLDQEACDAASPSAGELFTLG